jgi:N-acetylglucosaminyldiphosphoundecaprenol N-acetyl-beta-D-mannosaminyltransferase
MHTASTSIVGMRVDTASYRTAARRIEALADRGGAAYVCVANVHMVMEAHDSPLFREVVNGAALVVADGMPLAVVQRLMGSSAARQVRGTDLVRVVARRAARRGTGVAVYGGTPATAQGVAARLGTIAPGLDVRLVISPPFRQQRADERRADIERLRASGARIVFVGLGCPKQEQWMAEHTGDLDAVLIGVGAAFDFLAASKPEAPRWIQRVGLEWLFRLSSEPRRLLLRYARHNPRFVALVARQLWRSRRAA